MPDAALPLAPPSPAPSTSVEAPTPAQGLVLTEEQKSAWRNRITAALEGTKPAIEDGKTNVARYNAKHLTNAPTDDTCVVPTDFYYTEAKKAQIFGRLPDVFVKPEQPGLDDAAVVFQAALNKKLGPRALNILPIVQQVIVDVVLATGYGAIATGLQTVIGDPAEVPVEVGQEPDPDVQIPPMAGSVLGIGHVPMRPVFQLAPNIVAKWFFAERVKPGDLLVPPDFTDLDFDKADFLGQRFREDVPDGEAPGRSSDDDDRRLTPLPSAAKAAQRKQRTGYEVWYRAYRFDPDVKHPDKIRTFKIYDDDTNEQIVVRDHPHQRYKNPAGELLKGMQGYPISPLTLRYVSDTWMSSSDATMARNTADELSKGRTQMLRSRDRNMPQWGYDSTRVDKDIQGKIEKNEVQGGIPFNGPGQDATWPIQKGNAPKETYTFNDYAQTDLDRIWRLPPNVRGELDTKSRTATEQQIAASSSNDAHEQDRSVVLSWYVNKVVTKIAALMQLYCTETEYVELLGADAQRLKSIPPEVQQAAQKAGQDARVLVPWNAEAIAGLFAFSVKPNSQVFLDAAQEARLMMDDYQFFANSPNINKAELERQILTRRGYDVSRIMQQPPPKQADAPAVSLSVKGEDFNPLNAQAPILLDALAKLGVPIDLQAVQAAQQLAAQVPPAVGPDGQHGAPPQSEHGGAVAKAEPLSKHQADHTGGMQKTGAPAPMGAGGRA